MNLHGGLKGAVVFWHDQWDVSSFFTTLCGLTHIEITSSTYSTRTLSISGVPATTPSQKQAGAKTYSTTLVVQQQRGWPSPHDTRAIGPSIPSGKGRRVDLAMLKVQGRPVYEAMILIIRQLLMNLPCGPSGIPSRTYPALYSVQLRRVTSTKPRQMEVGHCTLAEENL